MVITVRLLQLNEEMLLMKLERMTLGRHMTYNGSGKHAFRSRLSSLEDAALREKFTHKLQHLLPLLRGVQMHEV